MITRKRVMIGLAGAAAATAVAVPAMRFSSGGSIDVLIGSTPTPTATPTPTPDPELFNVAVLDGVNGSTCDSTPTRLTTPVAGASVPLASTACTFDQAWDAMSAGDQAFIRNDTYPRQFVTGDKASDTKLIGESKAGVVIDDTASDCRPAFAASTLLCADGNFIWIENVTVDTDDEQEANPGSLVAGTDVTYKNVDFVGNWPSLSIGSAVPECTGCDADRFTWDGGTYGDVDPPPIPCVPDPGSNGEPLWVYDTDVTVKHVVFNKQTVVLESTCGPDNNFHLEFIRLESGATDFTFAFNAFRPGSDSGSGYFYSSADPTGLRVIGNFFADNSGSTWAQIDSAPCGYLVAYNTFEGNDGADFTSAGGCSPTWVGNFGTNQGSGGTHVKNRFAGSGSSGTNTYFGATDPDVDSATGHIGASSPAIDQAETTGASVIFEDEIEASDIDGDPRPCGAAYDAGADERC